MSTFAQALALTYRNAKACEEATQPRCVCYCQGRGHGKAHPQNEVEKAARELYQSLGGTEIPMDFNG